MPKKPTPMDAQLILHLYDLRREAELRKARNWWLTEFWPLNADDFLKVAGNLGSQENNWLRQVGSYWSMAAAFALNGALNADLFLLPANSGEMYFILAKVHPYLKDIREKLGDPEVFGNIEKIVTSTKYGRERLKFTLKRIESMHEKRAAAKAS
jgi:hypothetical protein